MASFFQPPGSGDPAIEACNTTDVHIYCNSLLPASGRLRDWYQQLNLLVASSAIALAAAALLCSLLHRLWSKWRRTNATCNGREDVTVDGSATCLTSLEGITMVRSFRFCSADTFSSAVLEDGSYDMLIVPLHPEEDGHVSIAGLPGPLTQHLGSGRPVLGLVDLTSPSWNSRDESFPLSILDHVVKSCHAAGLSGIVLQVAEHTASSKAINDIMDKLNSSRTPVIIAGGHDDAILDEVDLSLVVGIIVEGACILRDGERRDFFRANRLRQIMNRCAAQSEERPDFFVGFHDLWEQQPTPGIIKRALKLAEHYGAVLEHGPAPSLFAERDIYRKCPHTLSGFEYLRRPECTELQKVWMQEKRKTYIPQADVPPPKIAALPLEEIQAVIPNIAELLKPTNLPDELLRVQNERCPQIPSPEFVAYAPPRFDFWNTSSDGEPLSSLGSYPILASATPKHYDEVLRTQCHLRDLEMLHRLEGSDLTKLMDQLIGFRPLSSFGTLIDALIDGLRSQRIPVYKGLGTGFRMPNNALQLWGLSVSHDAASSCVDIFISQKAPSDVGTLLHTWLAHHGIPRVERLEEELRLERGTVATTGIFDLPLSIRTELEGATNSELLFLSQQLLVSGLNHPFREAIERHCNALLLDASSHAAWTQAHSLDFQAGTVDMRALLTRRLGELARRGAIELPSLEKLMELHELINSTMTKALFEGDRDTLNALCDALLHSYDPWESWTWVNFVDINAELFALIFFCILRREALDDVYIEATDRCPFFLSQPDQAAVFSELWVLGSQCELYFGMLPRDVGSIIYQRYREFLDQHPPAEGSWDKKELMTMYMKAEISKAPGADMLQNTTGVKSKLTSYQRYARMKKVILEFGAMSIFCLPAIIDVVLLTFVGRGLFMTAFMPVKILTVACYALLMSLLLTAGVTGWVGSVGNYYLCNYAYDNMIVFHVQRLSGGFVLTLFVGIFGMIGFTFTYSAGIGFLFFAYMVAIATYLNLLGVMATMHQRGSPLTSGRTVLWRTVPVLFISPALSAVLDVHDTKIYLPVIYGFLFLVLFQYRKLCHEWSGWLAKIPKLAEKDVISWYQTRRESRHGDLSSGYGLASDTDSEEESVDPKKAAQLAFKAAVEAYGSRFATRAAAQRDPVVSRVAEGMPYVKWLFHKEHPNASTSEPFTTAWFGQLGQALNNQKSLSRGLKEHSIFMLFRLARFDVGQNVGLFLIALMDRWVSITMSGLDPPVSLYTDSRARYGVCFALVYFCASVMMLDATLQNYWDDRYKLSEEKLTDLGHARAVFKQWDWRRRQRYFTAIYDLFKKLTFVFGCTTLLLWLFVDNPQTILLYYMYVVGYTGVMLFQFNRCFTTDVKSHVASILAGAICGYLGGCILHSLAWTRDFYYIDVIALDFASAVAAFLTFVFVWKDFQYRSKKVESRDETGTQREAFIWKQCRLNSQNADAGSSDPKDWKQFAGKKLNRDSRGFVSQQILALLGAGLDTPNLFASETLWSEDLLETALGMWEAGNVVVNVSTRSNFIESGFRHVNSFSKFDGYLLHITTGFLEQAENSSPSWEPLLSYLVAESVLYHVARAVLHLDHAQAVQAEHFLPETDSVSRRIDFELACQDSSHLKSTMRKTNVELMKHLCLGLDVETKWNDLPLSVREAVLSRVTNKSTRVSQAFSHWLGVSSTNLETTEFHIALCLTIHKKAAARLNTLILPSGTGSLDEQENLAELRCFPVHPGRVQTSLFWRLWDIIVQIPVVFTKWVGIITGAGSDIERELWYALRRVIFRDIIVWIMLVSWKLCCLIKNAWVYVLLIYHRPALVNISRLARKGASRKLKRNAIVVQFPRKMITGFASRNEQNTLTLDIYEGHHKTRPEDKDPVSKAVYDEKLRLSSRKDMGSTSTNISTYEYRQDKSASRWPAAKYTIDGDTRWQCNYDRHGRVTHGVVSFGTRFIKFKYYYKTTPKNCGDILKADFESFESSDSLTVFWGTPLRTEPGTKCDWVPSDRVCRVVRKINGKTYVTVSYCQHRRDPIMQTIIDNDGERVAVAETPKVFPDEELLLQRPPAPTFDADDLLIHHLSQHIRTIYRNAGTKRSWMAVLNPFAWSYFWAKTVYRSVPTWWLRTELWNNWLKTGTLDAVTACWMDEFLLREEPMLRKYWRYRDVGQLPAAKKFLDANIDQIVAAIEIEKDVSEVCMLPIKSADLYAMGLGKDATQVTNRPEDCYKDTKDRISVIFNDIGCWPEAPGGVSNCRRDLVNGHSTIRNHVLAESANDYGIPRFQIERNVQSLKILPLWGLDGKTPNHGVIDNLLQTQVDSKITNTDVKRDIVNTFVPLLKLFVKGARSKSHSRGALIQFSNVMLTIFKYFEHKDYNETWQSKEVQRAWVEAWMMAYEDPNVTDPSEHFEIERPTMTDFRDALGIYISYFFIFSVQTPKAEDCPRVFQSTHHGISSLFGMLLRHRRGTTFGIWDHAILWRESCLNISPAQCSLSIPVQSMLLAGIGLATRLAYFHADVILPCTSVFNPIWEAELGTDRGRIGSRKLFCRKIDPIVNGISDMDAFKPVDKVRSEVPTVVMLSNIQFIKDIKTALLAADVIINKYGFKDYKLLIYGAQDRQPSYFLEMTRIIQQCNLGDKVSLAGFGSPKEVLKDAWLFMNSSLSEGLPLAIGEAALAGVPIVATEVGATALVMTDPDDANQKYGEVVPPNDPVALARAQLSMLAMVGPWTKFTDDRTSGVTLPDAIGPDEVAWVTRRMYERVADRRKLGMLSRSVVLRSFHGKRYLREHEQMYWIQWHLARVAADPALKETTFRFGTPAPLVFVEQRGGEEMGKAAGGVKDEVEREKVKKNSRGGGRWQEFPSNAYKGKRLSKMRIEERRLLKGE